MDRQLKDTLIEGYNAIVASYGTETPLQEGIIGKALSIGALVAGTLFSGCAAGGNRADIAPVDIPPETPVTDDSVSKLAEEIASNIRDEMEDSSSVTDTKSWQAAKDIYGKLVGNDRKALADMFARVINRENKKLFNAPPCCDDRQFDNAEHEAETKEAVYDNETGSWDYN